MTRSTTSEPSAFQKFAALTRRILTTPKAELAKDAPKKSAKRSVKKRK